MRPPSLLFINYWQALPFYLSKRLGEFLIICMGNNQVKRPDSKLKKMVRSSLNLPVFRLQFSKPDIPRVHMNFWMVPGRPAKILIPCSIFALVLMHDFVAEKNYLNQ